MFDSNFTDYRTHGIKFINEDEIIVGLQKIGVGDNGLCRINSETKEFEFSEFFENTFNWPSEIYSTYDSEIVCIPVFNSFYYLLSYDNGETFTKVDLPPDLTARNYATTIIDDNLFLSRVSGLFRLKLPVINSLENETRNNNKFWFVGNQIIGEIQSNNLGNNNIHVFTLNGEMILNKDLFLNEGMNNINLELNTDANLILIVFDNAVYKIVK